MDLINFPASLAKNGTLNPADVITTEDLVLVGKKMNNLRNGTQYQPQYMRMDEFFSLNQGGSRLIASLESVDLQTIAANVLNWESGKSAANTANHIMNIIPISGIYSAISAVQGYCEISIDSGNEGNTNFSVGGVSMADIIGTQDQASVIAILVGTFPPSGWAITNPTGNVIRFTESIAQSGTNNGDTILVQTDGSITTSGATAVSGGVAATKVEATFMNLTQDITGSIAQLIAEDNIYSTTSGSVLISSSGDISLPVTQGTQDSFVVSIYIYGDTI